MQVILNIFAAVLLCTVASGAGRANDLSEERFSASHAKNLAINRRRGATFAVDFTSGSSSGSDEASEFERVPLITKSSEEHLPAEKGELGIPEQIMKVRHGVYKGNVAVFVDSESEENGASKGKGAGAMVPEKGKPVAPSKITQTILSKFPIVQKVTSSSTTTTTRKPTTTTKVTTTPKPTTRSTTRIPTTRTTKKVVVTFTPSTKPPTTRKVTDKPLTTTLRTTTRVPFLPIILFSHHTAPNTPTKIIVPAPAPVKMTPAPARPMGRKLAAPRCLSLGGACRRHNDCCSHNCNWRMGMKCDYSAW